MIRAPFNLERMNIVHSLFFAPLVIFNLIELSLASSPPQSYDFVSQLDQRAEPGSNGASSSHSHLAGEGLPQTELRLGANPGTRMHFYMDAQKPPTIQKISRQMLEQVPMNVNNFPSTMLNCKKTEFNFMSGFKYWMSEEFEEESDGKPIHGKHRTAPITPGMHKVMMNYYQEAVGLSYKEGHTSFIGYRGLPVALRWENEKLGVRFLGPSEITYLKKLVAASRGNKV